MEKASGGIQETTLKATIAYDGGAYVGWQRQISGMTVQQRLEDVLKQLAGRIVTTHGASRTDQGVHALGLVVGWKWDLKRMPVEQLRRALNGLLPADIRVLKLARAKAGFNARFDAKWKLYRYRILNRDVADPFRRAGTWFIFGKMDVKAMRKAAACFVGKHHFGAFAVNPGYERTSMVREIRRCLVRSKGDEIQIEVEGNAFLYKMVRSMVGTLVEVGMGKRPADSIRTLLVSRDRRQAGKTAPPQGLYLVKVFYRRSAARVIP
ncbi:MAG: tRNA pseudouridine(38-40) synthase TruA [Verrucomicrobiae bacterium]|nr:tRNA pseudouridine(38-40) synthase TruA [Verrucomicrobiae bacterium]